MLELKLTAHEVLPQYAYRPGQNAQQAAVEVEELLFCGHRDVVDAELADFFGSIPHAELMKSVARRIVGRRVLDLIKMWLECPVEETGNQVRKRRTIDVRDGGRGIPQGSPVSPLPADLYLRRSCWDERNSACMSALAAGS
jgi:RNA-directed DNA polymerase